MLIGSLLPGQAYSSKSLIVLPTLGITLNVYLIRYPPLMCGGRTHTSGSRLYNIVFFFTFYSYKPSPFLNSSHPRFFTSSLLHTLNSLHPHFFTSSILHFKASLSLQARIYANLNCSRYYIHSSVFDLSLDMESAIMVRWGRTFHLCSWLGSHKRPPRPPATHESS
jgi:hypothetical protein